MELTRVVLTRGNQELVIQGMVHVAPESLYQKLQKDIDWAEQNSYQIFFEGVRNNVRNRTLSVEKKKIFDLFEALFSLYPIFAAALGFSEQNEKIKYPKSAINADMSYGYFLKRLVDLGFDCSLFVTIFDLINTDEELKEKGQNLKEKVVETLRSATPEDFVRTDKRKSFTSVITTGVLSFFLRKAIRVIIRERNEFAVRRINARMKSNKVFVHYGDGHVKGLISLLKKEGWRVSARTTTTVEAYF